MNLDPTTKRAFDRREFLITVAGGGSLSIGSQPLLG